MSEEGLNGYQIHEAFRGAGQEAGLQIWRIEDFEPVQVDRKTYGSFYNGDAYIVLNSKELYGVVRRWDIHFWLGRSCTPDEAGSAAYYTVELDDSLGGAPVQYREVQGHESKSFLSLFKSGIKYLEGGVKSGFKTVEPTKYTRRLFHCKGKHRVHIEQVEVHFASLDQGGVFILDDGQKIYVWIGPKSSRMARFKGLEMARSIRDEERSGRAHIRVIENQWNTHEEFFDLLGRRDKIIRSVDDEDDADVIRRIDQPIVLYKIFERDGGDCGMYEHGEKPLRRDMLDSRSCYVLDSGFVGIFVWTGKECSMEFKKKVWKTVNEFLDARGYPDWLTVTRVLDGGETPFFKQYFYDWPDSRGVDILKLDSTDEPDGAPLSPNSFDGKELHEQPTKFEGYLPDDGSGKVEVWRIEDFELAPVPEDRYGIFFGGDSYVILYTYQSEGRDAHLIYFWQGLKSTLDEKVASALHAMNIDDNLLGERIQVRVTMNKEPAHFLKMFKGKMIVYKDGHVSGFRNVHDHSTYNPKDPAMFHIRGEVKDQTRALQVDCRGSSLNSGDVFVVDAPDARFIWMGKYANESEKEMAEYMIPFLAPGRSEPVVVHEDNESLVFWNTIGGKERYYTGPKKQETLIIPPRLFHCSNATGKFRVEEICDFTQEDLDEDDVMILDTYDEIFIWIGKGSNEFERKESMKTANTYLLSDPTGRTPEETLMIRVKQGFEPLSFTGLFHLWDKELWSNGKTFKELVDEIGKENDAIELITEVTKAHEEVEEVKVYSIEQLKDDTNKLPGVDVRKKETYLSEEDFKYLFQLTREEFYAKPEWKQTMLKKEVGLF